MVAAVAVFGMKPAESDDVAKLRQEVAELKAALLADRLTTTKTAEDVSHLSRTSPPVGTVTAFAGTWPPKRSDGGVWTEAEIGWLLCDGRKWEDKSLDGVRADLWELRAVLDGPNYIPQRSAPHALHLPDYRGYFLRGLDTSPFMGPAGRDKGEPRTVGLSQGYATARPAGKDAFTTDKKGAHSHPLKMELKASRKAGGAAENAHTVTSINDENKKSQLPLEKDGDHVHEITGGGDAETRPVNVVVYWVIKFK
ncbi:hypothetical protein C1280_08065 [Gemmata obscuriglobus]|uniref:Tail fiber protein n=2 Tax=Gemmata obscuriglobus TaxID=114 RepID=A0A2Z3GRI8_9BACT|nr:hypothetical protein C1280_08065 [Gemmata obscuriglobus]